MGRSLTNEGLGSNAPFDVSLTAVNGEAETVTFDGRTGPDSSRVCHPMLSPNSWIRAMPEPGANVVISALHNAHRRSTLAYYSRVTAEYIARYKAGIGVYRPLVSGEFDLMTPKLASIFGSVEGKLFLRGGPVQQELDPILLRHRSRAPTFRRELHQNLWSKMGDQENFGVVSRYDASKKKETWVKVPLEGLTTEKDYKGKLKTDSFAKEYLRSLVRDGKYLVDHREGDVIDDDGKTVKQTRTGKPLRYRKYLFSKGNTLEGVSIEVDENGGIFLFTPGGSIDLVASLAKLGVETKSMSVKVTNSIKMQSGTITEVIGGTVGMFYGKTKTVLGSNPNASNGVIKGSQLYATVLKPLLAQMSAHFAAGSSALTFDLYKPLMISMASTISTLSSLLDSTLSTNVKVS